MEKVTAEIIRQEALPDAASDFEVFESQLGVSYPESPVEIAFALADESRGGNWGSTREIKRNFSFSYTTCSSSTAVAVGPLLLPLESMNKMGVASSPSTVVRQTMPPATFSISTNTTAISGSVVSVDSDKNSMYVHLGSDVRGTGPRPGAQPNNTTDHHYDANHMASCGMSTSVPDRDSQKSSLFFSAAPAESDGARECIALSLACPRSPPPPPFPLFSPLLSATPTPPTSARRSCTLSSTARSSYRPEDGSSTFIPPCVPNLEGEWPPPHHHHHFYYPPPHPYEERGDGGSYGLFPRCSPISAGQEEGWRLPQLSTSRASPISIVVSSSSGSWFPSSSFPSCSVSSPSFSGLLVLPPPGISTHHISWGTMEESHVAKDAAEDSSFGEGFPHSFTSTRSGSLQGSASIPITSSSNDKNEGMAEHDKEDNNNNSECHCDFLSSLAAEATTKPIIYDLPPSSGPPIASASTPSLMEEYGGPRRTQSSSSAVAIPPPPLLGSCRTSTPDKERKEKQGEEIGTKTDPHYSSPLFSASPFSSVPFVASSPLPQWPPPPPPVYPLHFPSLPSAREDYSSTGANYCYHQLLLQFVKGAFLYYHEEKKKDAFYDVYCRVVNEVRDVLEVETLHPSIGLFPFVVSPAYVFGSIHGNFETLCRFLDRIGLGPAAPLLHFTLDSSIIFLGDYVDQGSFSLECVMLLFSLKVLCGSKFIMLRGNHEDPAVCGDLRTYGTSSFVAQCQRLFGYRRGMALFRDITSVFRYLPLAAQLCLMPPGADVEMSSQPLHTSLPPSLHAPSGGGGRGDGNGGRDAEVRDENFQARCLGGEAVMKQAARDRSLSTDEQDKEEEKKGKGMKKNGDAGNEEEEEQSGDATITTSTADPHRIDVAMYPFIGKYNKGDRVHGRQGDCLPLSSSSFSLPLSSSGESYFSSSCGSSPSCPFNRKDNCVGNLSKSDERHNSTITNTPVFQSFHPSILCIHGSIPFPDGERNLANNSSSIFGVPSSSVSLLLLQQLRHFTFPRLVTLFPQHMAVRNQPEACDEDYTKRLLPVLLEKYASLIKRWYPNGEESSVSRSIQGEEKYEMRIGTNASLPSCGFHHNFYSTPPPSWTASSPCHQGDHHRQSLPPPPPASSVHNGNTFHQQRQIVFDLLWSHLNDDDEEKKVEEEEDEERREVYLCLPSPSSTVTIGEDPLRPIHLHDCQPQPASIPCSALSLHCMVRGGHGEVSSNKEEEKTTRTEEDVHDFSSSAFSLGFRKTSSFPVWNASNSSFFVWRTLEHRNEQGEKTKMQLLSLHTTSLGWAFSPQCRAGQQREMGGGGGGQHPSSFSSFQPSQAFPACTRCCMIIRPHPSKVNLPSSTATTATNPSSRVLAIFPSSDGTLQNCAAGGGMMVGLPYGGGGSA